MTVKTARDPQLAELVDMQDPAAVLEEVKYNFIHHYSIAEFADVRKVFRDFLDLMDGRYPGYRPCNTKYHDKTHTTDGLLAASRLIDGYNIKNPALPVKRVKVCLMATIFHDSGYVQTVDDVEGTGAKYTVGHVERSVVFMQEYFKREKHSEEELAAASNMVRCTGFATNIAGIHFSSPAERTLGLMLGVADLMGQMASRTYLERLSFLYREYEEGEVPGYESELDLLKKTKQFYADVKNRFEKDFDNVQTWALFHFQQRYRINKNLYQEAIARDVAYLEDVLAGDPHTYRAKLRRRIEDV